MPKQFKMPALLKPSRLLKVLGLVLMMSSCLPREPITVANHPCRKSNFVCSKKINDILTLAWRIVDDETIEYRFQKNKKGHAFIGLGASMSAGDVWEFTRSGNTVSIRDCHLTGRTAPTCTETQSVTLVDQTTDANSFSVTFSRKIDTGETDKDRVIIINDP